MIKIDAIAGTLEVKIDPAAWAARVPDTADLSGNQHGVGRELFAAFRQVVSTADTGASIFMGLAA
jgi:phosphogluconate dehydratase